MGSTIFFTDIGKKLSDKIPKGGKKFNDYLGNPCQQDFNIYTTHN